jgi:two-component system, NtrC family, response regulator AtoC
MSRRILLIEDEENYRKVFALMVADLGVELLEAGDGQAGLEALGREEVDLVVTDLNMPRLDGMSLLKEIRQKWPQLPVVVVTAYGTVESAVEAIRAGAIDYLPKPFDSARLRMTLERALKVTDLLDENRRLRNAVEHRYDFSQILGRSPALLAALKVAGQLAASDSPVLIQGESGTGKELVAQAIHFNSNRRAGPFLAVNCAALPDTLLESELFGAEAGAYTGAAKRRRGRVELARRGTLFLDEIGDMPPPLQAKILRLIQERTYTPLGGEAEVRADVRFVFATHRDLKELVAKEKFREDLYYRVAGLPVLLPPLRDRQDDVLLLAEALVARFCQSMGRKALRLSSGAKDALRTYPFPGNVRELSNLMERAVLVTEDGDIEAHTLSLPAAPTQISRTVANGFILPEAGISLEALEKDLVRQALQQAKGNKSRAAKYLGLTRATLRYRVEKLGLEDGTDNDPEG